MGIDETTFYDPDQVVLTPVGFCYPGVSKSGGDLAPRPEYAPLWHDRLRQHLTHVRLTLLDGLHAQKVYMRDIPGATLTKNVRNLGQTLPGRAPLPHPAWRSIGWRLRSTKRRLALDASAKVWLRPMSTRLGELRPLPRYVIGVTCLSVTGLTEATGKVCLDDANRDAFGRSAERWPAIKPNCNARCCARIAKTRQSRQICIKT
jgi:hypothetical protein